MILYTGLVHSKTIVVVSVCIATSQLTKYPQSSTTISVNNYVAYYLSKHLLRIGRPNTEVFFMVFDYASEVDPKKGCWNSKRKLGVAMHFSESHISTDKSKKL